MTPEEAVIGACLLNPDVIRLATGAGLMPSDFNTWQGEQIFQAIVDIRAMGRPVDVVTVSSELTRRGSKVSALMLHEVIAQVPTAESVAFYAEAVREGSIRRSLRTVAARLSGDAENEMKAPGVALQEALAGLKAVRDDSPDVQGLRMRKLGDIMAEDEGSYDWVIKHLFERGDRLILTGEEGTGKSMMIRQMAILAAAGIHPFWLYPIEPVRVMVIDRENSERQWRRKSREVWDKARRFGKGNPADLELSCDLRPMDITRDADLGKIHRKLDEYPADMLFIGPLYKLVPRAVQTDDEAAPVLAALDSLRERGCVLVTEAHAGHDRGDSLRPVGSSAFLRWPEFGRGLRKDKTVAGRVRLEKWRGDRDERAMPEAFMRGGPVPWTAENTRPDLIGKFSQPDDGGQPQLGGHFGY